MKEKILKIIFDREASMIAIKTHYNEHIKY